MFEILNLVACKFRSRMDVRAIVVFDLVRVDFDSMSFEIFIK